MNLADMYHGYHPKTNELERGMLNPSNADLADLIIGDSPVVSNRVYHRLMPSGGNCPSAERCHLNVLFRGARFHHDDGYVSPPGTYYRRGAMILLDGEAVGYVKLKGAHTFLATRAVRTTAGRYSLLRYGIYSISQSLHSRLQSTDLFPNQWAVMPVARLEVMFHRFLMPEHIKVPQDYHRYPDFAAQISREMRAFERRLSTQT